MSPLDLKLGLLGPDAGASSKPMVPCNFYFTNTVDAQKFYCMKEKMNEGGLKVGAPSDMTPLLLLVFGSFPALPAAGFQ